MAAAIDPSLVHDHSPWSQRAYAILDNMGARGNCSAILIRSELKQLDDELAQLLSKGSMANVLPANTLDGPGKRSNPKDIASPVASGEHSHSLELDFCRKLWKTLRA